jgi:transposase
MKQDSKITVGIDLGDKKSYLCLLDNASGEVLEENHLPTTKLAFERYFAGKAGMKVVLETGTHSAWVSQLLEEMAAPTFFEPHHAPSSSGTLQSA